MAIDAERINKDLESRISKLENYVKIAVVLAGALGLSVGGTIAWLSVRAREVDKKIDAANILLEKANRLLVDIDGRVKDELDREAPPLIKSYISKNMGDFQKRLTSLEASSNCYASDWLPVNSNSYYQIEHNLKQVPTKAWIWSSAEKPGQKVVLVDSINSSGGYGAWLIDVGANSATLSTGDKAATSLYGHVDQWHYWDGGIATSPPRSQRFLKAVLCI